jgi:hypothetical protein
VRCAGALAQASWPCCGRAVGALWARCGRAVAVLWPCCGRAVGVLASHQTRTRCLPARCGRAVAVLWPCCGRAVGALWACSLHTRLALDAYRRAVGALWACLLHTRLALDAYRRDPKQPCVSENWEAGDPKACCAILLGMRKTLTSRKETPILRARVRVGVGVRGRRDRFGVIGELYYYHYHYYWHLYYRYYYYYYYPGARRGAHMQWARVGVRVRVGAYSAWALVWLATVSIRVLRAEPPCTPPEARSAQATRVVSLTQLLRGRVAGGAVGVVLVVLWAVVRGCGRRGAAQRGHGAAAGGWSGGVGLRVGSRPSARRPCASCGSRATRRRRTPHSTPRSTARSWRRPGWCATRCRWRRAPALATSRSTWP